MRVCSIWRKCGVFLRDLKGFCCGINLNRKVSWQIDDSLQEALICVDVMRIRKAYAGNWECASCGFVSLLGNPGRRDRWLMCNVRNAWWLSEGVFLEVPVIRNLIQKHVFTTVIMLDKFYWLVRHQGSFIHVLHSLRSIPTHKFYFLFSFLIDRFT